MTKVTIKTPALRGVMQIFQKDDNPDVWLAVGSSYKPMQFEAASLGEAVNMFMQNIHRLQRSEEAKAKSAARAIKTQATRLANEQSASR